MFIELVCCKEPFCRVGEFSLLMRCSALQLLSVRGCVRGLVEVY